MNWCDILKGRYSVSDTGLVRLNYRRNRNGVIIRVNKLMSPALRKDGYLRVPLTDNNGIRKHYYVHRLVGEAFLLNPENLETINHKDCDRSNNDLSNLEWMSHFDNCEYSQATTISLRNPEGVILEIFNVNKFCRDNNLSSAGVYNVLNGRRPHHKGYTNV